MDGVPFKNSVWRWSYWGYRWGRTLSTQLVGALGVQPSLGLLLADTGSLFWSLSSSCLQRPGSLLGPFKETPWTRPKRSEPSFLLLTSAYAATSRSWFDHKEKRPQTEFGWARWLRRWQNGLRITDRSYNTLCETYRGRRPGSWPWVCLQILPLKYGETSGWFYPGPVDYSD